MTRDYDDAMRQLILEELPCHRLPKPDNGDGPTARMMAVERQRRLWAGEFTDESTADTAVPGVAS